MQDSPQRSPVDVVSLTFTHGRDQVPKGQAIRVIRQDGGDRLAIGFPETSSQARKRFRVCKPCFFALNLGIHPVGSKDQAFRSPHDLESFPCLSPRQPLGEFRPAQ